jgi:xanthine dehydrogenase accessory factor
MRVILDSLLSELQQQRPVVMGAIIRSNGSAPRGCGARMLIRNDGSLIGTIGGGELEGDSIAAARSLLSGATDHRLLHFNLSTAEAARAGMVCGGRQQVLLQRLQPNSENLDLFQELDAALANHDRPVLLTVLPPGQAPSLHLLSPHLALPQDLLSNLLHKGVRASQPFCQEADGIFVFAEPVLHPPRLHLAGAGHVAQAVATIATVAGFAVRVFDDRSEFANQQRFPNAEAVEVADDLNTCLGELGCNDYVVIVTRGHLHDRDILRQALRSRAGFIGMIGSRSKRDATYRALEEEGFDSRDFARVHCPIGLDIGGDSPGEIGLSIVAQLQAAKFGKLP